MKWPRPHLTIMLTTLILSVAACRAAPVDCQTGDSVCGPLPFLILVQQKSRDRVVEKIYWIDNNSVLRRSGGDGSNVQDLVAGISNPGFMRLDPIGGKVYWGETSNNQIGAANLDGSGAVYIATPGHNPRGIHIDSAAGVIYYTDNGNNALARINTDGTGQATVAASTSPLGMAFDGRTNRFYVCEPGVGVTLRSPDGTLVDTLLDSLTVPADIRIDSLENRLYVADTPAQHISTDIAGGDIVVLASGFSTGGIALDTAASTVYLADQTSSFIFTTDLGGGNRRDLLTSATVNTPVSIDLLFKEPD